MLIIKAEIWPGGHADRRFEIARLGLTNISGGQSSIADYTVVGLLDRDHRERVVQGTVQAHVRHLGWMPLVARALTEHQDDDFLHAEYVEAVAELLRKG